MNDEEIIEGLAEIREAMETHSQWMKEVLRYFPRKCPTPIPDKYAKRQEVDELHEQYPRASAYLYAEWVSKTKGKMKSAAGKRAMARILDGEDFNQVIDDMKEDVREAI